MTPTSAYSRPARGARLPQSLPGRPGTTASRGGFTLLEVLVVLAIVAAITGIVAPAGWRALQSARLRGAEADLQAALATLPMRAFGQGQPLVVDSTVLTRQLESLPEDCRLHVAEPLRYAANGMAGGGTVQLACAAAVSTFDVAEVTGAVRRAAAERR